MMEQILTYLDNNAPANVIACLFCQKRYITHPKQTVTRKAHLYIHTTLMFTCVTYPRTHTRAEVP